MNYSKDYYENLSKIILEFYFPDKFVNLKKGEKPDWCNSNIGLEVTRALCKQDGEFDAFLKKYLNHSDAGKRPTYSDMPKNQLKKLGFDTEPECYDNPYIYEHRSKRNGRLLYLKDKKSGELILWLSLGRFGMLTDCVESIKEAIEIKLKKLNKIYDNDKNENDLAVLIQEQLNTADGYPDILFPAMVDELIREIKEVYKVNMFDVKFNYIYFIYYDNIVCVDTKTFKFERTIISSEDYLQFSKRAMEVD